MGSTTTISYASATWNPWIGCQKISRGCVHCYAATWAARYGRDFSAVRRTTTMTDPLRWQSGQRILTCSLSDFFLDVPDDTRRDAWDVIRRTPHHTYMVLTKRADQIARGVPPDWGEGWPNVWLGVTVEDWGYTNRLDTLCALPAKTRWVSVEPMLSAVDISPWLPHLDWVVCGGESGARFRPLDMAWVRALRDQCGAAGVPFWFKQGNGIRPGFNPWIVEHDGSRWVYNQLPGALTAPRNMERESHV